MVFVLDGRFGVFSPSSIEIGCVVLVLNEI